MLCKVISLQYVHAWQATECQMRHSMVQKKSSIHYLKIERRNAIVYHFDNCRGGIKHKVYNHAVP